MLDTTLRARADRFRPSTVRAQVYNPQVRPHWIGDSDRFWYRREGPGGTVFTVVDAHDGGRTPAFDHAALAKALGVATLALGDLTIAPDGVARFTAAGGSWSWSDAGGLAALPPPEADRPGETRSPDGRHAALRHGDDLWLRDRTTGAERALTTDGAPCHAYAKSPDMNLTTVTLRQRGITLPAAVLWSPDGRKIFTSQLDERAVLEMPLLQHVPKDGSARPILHSLRIALSGDAELPMERYVAIDVATGAIVPADTAPSVVGVMTCVEREEAWWSADGTRVRFVDRDRYSRRATLNEFDAASGAVRTILTETAETFLEASVSVTGLPNIRILDRSNELIWFSQRDGFGHLYLHDLATGALKNPITSGAWVMRDLLHVDEVDRKVIFIAGGVDPAADPYHRVVCSAGLDGSGFAVLTPEPGDHAVAAPQKRVPRDHIRPVGDIGEFLSPSGGYFVHTHSTLERAPVSALRRIDGSLVGVVEEATLDPELAAAWRWPQMLRVQAADGATTLYGAMWLPTDFDPSRIYPVIDNIYPGPQRGITPTAMLSDQLADLGRSCLPQMFAELGFVVINLDGRGTPLRGKQFHDESYGHLDDPGMLADHVAGLRQLAARHPFMDIARVGIMGHSGGGYASVRALLEYPEDFHAAVATSGNHDQKGYSFTWCEKYMGPLIRQPDGRTNFDSAANPPLAARLQGKLLLAYGDMDDNVTPALTLQLAAALIAADKDFDLIVLPNDDHTTVWNNPYFLRRAMQFMVSSLSAAPPG